MTELGDEGVDEFLRSQTRRGTANTCRTQMRHYLEFAGKSGREPMRARANGNESLAKLSQKELTLAKNSSETCLPEQ